MIELESKVNHRVVATILQDYEDLLFRDKIMYHLFDSFKNHNMLQIETVTEKSRINHIHILMFVSSKF